MRLRHHHSPPPPPQVASERWGTLLLVGALLVFFTVGTAEGRSRIAAWISIATEATAPALPTTETALPRPAPSNALTPEQARIAAWISKRYRVSRVAVKEIVLASYDAAERHNVDPHLVLAVIAVESSFNPFAESSVGASGLMQVMPQIHADKFQPFGGTETALDPRINIYVGSAIIREYLARYGDLEAALRAYVGVGPDGETLYPEKIIGMRANIQAAARGRVLA